MISNLANFLGNVDPMGPEMAAVWSAAISASSGDGVYVPPGDWRLTATIQINRLRGEPGKSIIHIGDGFQLLSPSYKFAIHNTGYSTEAFNPITAPTIDMYGITIRCNSINRLSILGFANIAGGSIRYCDLEANDSAPEIPAIIDFYACAKNVTVSKTRISNQNKSTVGGGDIWIRNVVSSSFGGDPTNATENITIDDCDLIHDNIDESIAIYGVRGIVRNCHVKRSRIYSFGTPHQALMTIFPCDDGTGPGKGDNASVYGNSFENNEIIETASTKKVLRIGYTYFNGHDFDNQCYNNKIIGNRISVSTGNGITLESVVECDEDLFSESGSESSGNYASDNIIELSDNSRATAAVKGFTGCGGNTIFGPFGSHYALCTFEGVYPAETILSENGVREIQPNNGAPALEVIRAECGGLFPRMTNGVLSYRAGYSAP